MFNIKDLLSSPSAKYAAVLVVGVAVGALFYPSRHIEDKVSQKYEQEIKQIKEQHSKELSSSKEESDKLSKQLTMVKSESSLKISKLTTQVSELQSHQKTSYYKVVKPDGTVEVRKFSETDVSESTKVITSIQEEFKQKVDSIEQKWEQVHKERVIAIQKEFTNKESIYQHTIEELQKSHVEDINKRNFGLEVGVMTNKDYYLHADADIFGPVFIGVQTQLGPSQAAGAGLGLRF